MARTYSLVLFLIVLIALFVVLKISLSGQTFKNQNTSVVKSSVTKSPTLPVFNKLPLTIVEPINDSSTSASFITVSGKTVADADVFINSITKSADKNGNFSTSVPLDLGENIIHIAVNDSSGNFTTRQIKISKQPTSTNFVIINA